MSEPARMHLIGIGGSGMLPLALLLRQAGHTVTGSDGGCDPARLELLQEQGIAARVTPHAAQARGADCVVVSPAIPEIHVEKRAARREGVPLRTRAQMLASLIAERSSVCVAGSHGKSTTTAMLVHILDVVGAGDTGYMLGASFADPALQPARLGAATAPFVTEACEAHGALAEWRPAHVVLTNLDDDHADHYGGPEALKRAFADFVSRVPPGGRIVACGDDAQVADALHAARGAVLTYGFGAGNALRAVPDPAGGVSVSLDGNRLGALSLSVPGRHNLLNALGALGMALGLGVGFAAASRALAGFQGVARRLQRIPSDSPVRIFDDFAHHPAEIAASIAVLRETARGRVIALVEPQLHSRVAQMAPRFAQALSGADHSVILPVAALGEAAPEHDGNAALAAACAAAGLSCAHVTDEPDLLRRLQANLRNEDTLLVMAGTSGAGIARRIAAALAQSPANPAPLPAASLLTGDRTPPAPDLLTLVARHAAQNPGAPAVEMGHRRLDYADLVFRAGALARMLAGAGVRAGDSVGVCLGRSVDRVTAFLAILQLGGVFVPLDPALPEERLRVMIDAVGAGTIVVNAASPALPDDGLHVVNCGQVPDRDDAPANAVVPADIPAEALAYMIFTSGTTGAPKAVEIPRGALANYAVAAGRHFQITPGSRVSQLSGFGFDVSVGDMAMALAAGACLVFPTDLQAIPGPPVGRFIAQAGLTHLSLTPSALSIVPPAEHPALTHVIVAGEACPPALVERWGRGRCFINAYGPTEATIEALFAICTPGQPVTIGRPFDNMGACLMDKHHRLVAPGREGELCLFGPGLSRGYRNQPALTERQFPLVALPGFGEVRLYRTGDRAKAGPDGAFVYLGRKDSQLKVNGYRIEPAEVEAALCGNPDVSDAAVSRLAAPGMPDRLIAHLVMRAGAAAPDPVALRDALTTRLPSYMVPSVFLPVPEIPRNASGKRDRSALPLPPQLLAPPRARTVGTPTEARLIALIGEQLGAHVVTGTRGSLREAGVDSLSMATLLFAVEDAFGITLDTGFEEGFDTVEILGLMVDARLRAGRTPVSSGLDDDLRARIAPHLATWPGRALGKVGLVRSLSDTGALPRLFWCFQVGTELSRLSESLRDRVAVCGLRSGHLAVEYSADNLQALGRLYADEITAIAPTGPVFLGGNCQGGLVMREAGLELLRRGREVPLTMLMEQGRFFHYPARTLLIFGARSYLNPYGQIDGPEQLFRTAYPAGHRVEIIPGAHGHYFRPENVDTLAATLLRNMSPFFAEGRGTGADVAPIPRADDCLSPG
ncbi:amino acid adenylation domain-containing protein [Pararhodobacter marinus]|uniref:amino acid adenylation domain-containing protein n=1 Tax=Pararhodobacter marinus TaxID=2184063 RepID=UPI003519AA3E